MASDKVKKAPAFQFYPVEWDTDKNVVPMNYEEEGVYWALCRRYWMDGNTLPADLEALRALLKPTEGPKRDRRMSSEKFAAIWKRVGVCFRVVDGRLTHKRLEQERIKQAENRDKRKRAADERWARQQERKNGSTSNAHASDVHGRDLDLVQCLSSSSSSSSSTAVVEEPPRPAQPRLVPADQPRGYDRQHANHVFGFCDWVCLPQFLVGEFIGKGGKTDEYVAAWAKGVRRQWEGQRIGDGLKFWRARWEESAPASGSDGFDEADRRAKAAIEETRQRHADVRR